MYDDLIAAAANTYGVDAALIRAVIQHESGFNSLAVGDGGKAWGLMQMHAPAAFEMGFDWNQMGDPATAINAGTAYLAKQLRRFNGDVAWALAAYNQGETVIGLGRAYADAVLALKAA